MADPSADANRCRKLFIVAVSEYLEHFPDTGPAAPDGWASDWISRHSTDVPEVAVDLQRYHAGQKAERLRAEEAVAAKPPTPTYHLEDITFDGEQKNGKMGVVRRGFDQIMRRTICVKQPQEPYKHSPGHRRRFFREALLLGQLQHPNIPPVYQFGWDTHGTPFFTTPWIDGDTLTDLLALDKGQENVSRFVTIFLQVCQAVGFAHGRKILHRDLKPEHVIIDKNETAVFVVDWGIGKALDAEEVGANEEAVAPENRSSSGIAGTPAYMAPEQATPGAMVGPPADVFGLGGILCFILTGAPPAWEGAPEDRGLVSGESSAVRSQLETRRIEHSALVDLALACLAKNPSDRPQNGTEVAESVQAYLKGITERLIEAERETAARRAEDQKKAAWRRVRVISAVALLTLVGVAGFVAQWQYRLVQENHGAVSALLDRCEQALRDSDPTAAEDALAEIDRRLPEGGGAAIQARLDRCRADLALLRELDRIDEYRWAFEDGCCPSAAKLAMRWTEACKRFGIDPGTTHPREAAQRVTDSLVRDRLLSTLDLLLLNAPSVGVRAILSEADPDEYRGGIRDAILAGRNADLVERVGRTEALKQPARFASVLGQFPGVPVSRRREVLEVALRDRPGDLILLMGLGSSYPINQRKGAEERVRWFQAAVAAHPRNMAAHDRLGVALAEKGDVDGAIREYLAAIRLDPNSPIPHNNLGNALKSKALKSKGDLNGAIREYLAAIRLDPTYALPHHNLGTALHDKRDLAGAAASYREAIRLDPTRALSHYGLGITFRDTGDPGGAASEFRKAIQLDPNNPLPHNALGVILFEQKDFDGAIAAYREAIRLDPTDEAAHNNLGNALRRKGDLDGAVAAYREAIRLDPNYAMPHHNLGVALQDKKDFAGAIAAYREAIRLGIRLAPTFNNLAVLLAERDEPYAALRVLREGLRVDLQFEKEFRYNLACFACLAATAQAKDAPPVADRLELRRDALRWLTEELAVHRARESVTSRHAIVHKRMLHWLSDKDLESVRNVEGIPPKERVAWAKLWGEVRKLRDETAPRELAPLPRPK